MEGVIGDTWAWGSPVYAASEARHGRDPVLSALLGPPLDGAQRPRHPAGEQRGAGGGRKLRTGTGLGAALKDPEGSFLWGTLVARWAAASQGWGAGGRGLCSEPSLEGGPSPGP